ncbi:MULTISPECIES: hypothetical protein [Streptosporangium]|uniref:hypothetical protein n=1 Tax=Streptosporangium TaxID=2000 RepID=UPI00105432BA|nr:hypothetical protein [Streptosporangium minutum]
MSGRPDLAALWETGPGVIDPPWDTGAFTGERLFALACTAAASRTTLPDPQDVRLFTDDNIVNPTQLAPYLPDRERDSGFAGYASRLRGQVTSFALTINSLQQFDWDFWRILRRQVDAVLAATGPGSAGGVDCHLIASAYGTAPTLIHKDTAGVFTHVISGTKRYYTWPFDVFAPIAGAEALQRQVNLPASVRVEDHRDTATVVEGGAGTVMYWPSDRWHCATSDGAATVSLHVAHYQWDDRLATVLRRLRKQAEADLGTARYLGGTPGEAGTDRADAVEAAVRKTLSRILEDTGLDLQTRLGRLRRRTASNFEVVPPPRPCPDLVAADLLTVPDVSAVATLAVDDTTHLAANGHVMRVRGGGWLDGFLAALEPGAARTLAGWSEAIRAAGGPPGLAEAATLVRELVRRGALDREGATP